MKIPLMYSSEVLCSRGGKILVLCAENAHAFLRELCRIKCPPLNVIIMREQLNVKQRQATSETPAKGGGGLVELLLVTWPEGRLSGQRPWLGCCLQGLVLIECYLERDSAD